MEFQSQILPDAEWFSEDKSDFVSLTHQAIQIEDMINCSRSPRAGAVSTFLGTTRDTFEGCEVTSLEYEAYTEMALSNMRELVLKVRSQWELIRVVIQHKLGTCPVGEVSVLIAISSAHRKESLEAVSFAIDELKKTVPVWKKECYASGDSAWKANSEFIPTGMISGPSDDSEATAKGDVV